MFRVGLVNSNLSGKDEQRGFDVVEHNSDVCIGDVYITKKTQSVALLFYRHVWTARCNSYDNRSSVFPSSNLIFDILIDIRSSLEPST